MTTPGSLCRKEAASFPIPYNSLLTGLAIC